MKKVITYGTFDLFHKGHYNLLKRAKELGDYLIVGVTTENYDNSRGKLNVQDSLMERVKNVKETGLADEIIIEEFEGQKINDILKYEVDIFAIGSDWKGKFDYINEYCEVVYLERTKGISSTELRARKNNLIRIGVVGAGRIANRFIVESKYVSGVNVEGVCSRNIGSAKSFAEKHQLKFYTCDYSVLLDSVDAVYIASPHLTHYDYVKNALLNNKHVLCEKPMVLSSEQAKELYSIANERKVVLMEAIKTAYCPGFIRLISLAKSGIIGNIKSIDAKFTKLVDYDVREMKKDNCGGSITELATYPLLAITKLLGDNITEVRFYSHFNDEVDIYTRANIIYKNAIATATVGLGVKSEGDLVISGTKGYIYVPSPWWKTEYFEVKFENFNYNKKYFYKFEGDGLRYEISDFISLINNNIIENYKLTQKESIKIIEVIEQFLNRDNVHIF